MVLRFAQNHKNNNKLFSYFESLIKIIIRSFLLNSMLINFEDENKTEEIISIFPPNQIKYKTVFVYSVGFSAVNFTISTSTIPSL